MIPKIIHYCWFGRGEKSPLIQKCIKSWKKYCPDYQFVEWNEDTFDIHSTLWTEQAYEAKKWAFVSDYVRLYALYHQGGIYLDTDVEICKPLDRFLEHEAFSGFENYHAAPTGIMASVAKQSVIRDWLSYYDDRAFIVDGQLQMTTNTEYMTAQLVAKGLVLNNTLQTIDGMTIYPKTFFCPMDMLDINKDQYSKDTYTIHHFTGTWRSEKGRNDNHRVRRHSTWWYRAYEQVAAYPIAAYRRLFKKR